jgi:hypothetical protein
MYSHIDSDSRCPDLSTEELQAPKNCVAGGVFVPEERLQQLLEAQKILGELRQRQTRKACRWYKNRYHTDPDFRRKEIERQRLIRQRHRELQQQTHESTDLAGGMRDATKC